MNSKNVLNEDNNDFFNIGAKELNEQDKKQIEGEGWPEIVLALAAGFAIGSIADAYLKYHTGYTLGEAVTYGCASFDQRVYKYLKEIEEQEKERRKKNDSANPDPDLSSL